MLGSYVPLLGNTLVESSNSTTVNSAGTLFLTTNNIIAPPLPVLPTFGNIYLECLASYGNIYISTNTGSNGTININSGTGGTIFTGLVTFNSPVVLSNISFGIQDIVSSGGTTTLTASSPYLNVVTGATFHTIVLPVTALIPNGTQYTINNNSTGGGVVVKNSALVTITSIPVGGDITLTLLISGSWDFHFAVPGNTSWGTATLSTSSIIQTSAQFYLSSFLATSINYMELYTPNQGVGIGNNIIFGHDASSNNAGLMSFVYNAPSSTTNYIGLGLYGGDAIRISAFTLPSTSTTTGALIVRGGLGVSGTINVAALNVISGTTTNATITTEFAGALGAGQTLIKEFGVDTLASNNSVRQVFGYVGSGSALNSWAFQFYNVGTTMSLLPPGTVSTSTVTGAVRVTGGLGVSGAINSASLALTTALPTTSGGTGLSTVGTNTQGNLSSLHSS